MPDSNQTLPLPTSPKDDPNPDKQPISPSSGAPKSPKLNPDAALKHIRDKVSQLYSTEPSEPEEEKEIIATGSQSTHQQFIEDLMGSSQSDSEKQKAWHSYYAALPDDEKHAVWNEFRKQQNDQNSMQNTQPSNAAEVAEPQTQPESPKQTVVEQPEPNPNPQSHTVATTGTFISGFIKPKENTQQDPKTSISSTKNALLDTVTARGKIKPKHHLQSLFFGLAMGLIVLTIFMFSFFNERFIAPFITPSRTASSSPIIIDPNAKVSDEPTMQIPKINVDVPVVYDLPSTAEKDIQAGLENGVVHYPSTPKPGEDGNVVIVGHSSNNLFNSGKYKFAFVLLNKLQEGDIVVTQYQGKRYVYKVFQRKIVKPSAVEVLSPIAPEGKKATITLITCDPPGTSINRLVVIAEQVSPDPSQNTVSSDPIASGEAPQTAIVPGNAPSLFQRLFSWL